MISTWINKFISKPDWLMLIDALGAFVTALSWFFWIFFFSDLFDLNTVYLWILFLIASAMFVLSISFYLLHVRNYQRCFSLMILGNTLFLVYVVGLLLFFWEDFSLLPQIYMATELFIISVLIYIEFKVKNTLN